MLEIGNDWDRVLSEQFNSEYFNELLTFLEIEYRLNNVFPPREDIFNAFKLCPVDKLKVVILGQDPYHEPGQAHGLAFSVRPGVKVPPSLKNIYKEMERDLNLPVNQDGDLSYLAEQGVLLLNTVLTVREGEANSHKNKGWETFTDTVIKKVSLKYSSIVFILWGKQAEAKEKLIKSNVHLILKSPHPSPLSARRGFFGCSHFSKTNEFLISKGKKPINWIK